MKFELIKRAVKNPALMYDYIQGNVRMLLRKCGLLNKEICNKVDQRIVLAKECYDNTECLACGCDTPGLFYCDKACSAPKYLDKPACYLALKDMDYVE